jgi:multiple sugar transport system substrate-binding protein
MKRIKPVAAIVLVTGVTALSACGSGGDNAGAPDLGGAEDGGTTMVIPVNRSPWLGAYQELVAQYEEETGIDIELREFPFEEMRTQYINDQQNDSGTFDLYHIPEGNIGEFFANEWVQPLHGIDPEFSLDDEVLSYSNFSYWDPERNVSSEDGELMALPLNGNVSLYMYRADVFEEQGLDVPRTWEDVVSTGVAAMSSGAADYGYVMRLQGVPSGSAITYDFMPLFYSYGGQWFVDEGADWTPDVDSEAGIAAARMLRELAQLGPAETTTLGQSEVIALMQAGQGLQTHLAAASAAGLENESDSNIAGDVGYAPMPAGDSGEPGPASGVFALAVPTGLTDERSQRALDFLNWLQGEDVQTAFGVRRVKPVA